MKPKLLLLFATCILVSSLFAQKSKQKQVTGFAITGTQKGQTGWKEVRLVDLNTGQEVKQIYKSTDEVELLNARTGKPIVKKDMNNNTTSSTKKIVNLDMELEQKEKVQAFAIDGDRKLKDLKLNAEQMQQLKQKTFNNVIIINKEVRNKLREQTDKPFATNSAACAYDKKHERLFYTPMGINQLRYIDLKSKTPKIYYFEDEPFGMVSGPGDAGNQICRMVIAADGNGYALSNNGDHLIRFTTGKNIVITDLGAVSDDPANNNYSVRSHGGYGGDMIADASGNLYVITGNRNVFKLAIDTRIATYHGTIKGLPQGFTTNGAMVEEGTKVIVCSSQSTAGYFRFDLTTMQAEKISSSETVFNASDLASGNLAFEKKKKKDKQKPEVVNEVVTEIVEETDPAVTQTQAQQEMMQKSRIAVYPNPVTNGFVKVSFADQPKGRYQLQFLDVSGQLISSKYVTINGSMQIEEFRLPQFVTKGTYLLKIINETSKASVVSQLTVQ